jgi:hypothetical protein
MEIIKLPGKDTRGETSVFWEVPATPALVYALVSMLVLIFGGRHVW